MSLNSNRICPKCGEEDFAKQDYCASCGNEFILDTTDSVKPLFFPVSVIKLALMSLATLGLYEVYWFYKNWGIIKDRENKTINPALRTIFTIFYCYPLFKVIRDTAKHHKTGKSLSPGLIALAFIIMQLSSRLPVPASLIGTFSFAPLLFVQTVVNDINAKVSPDIDRNEDFSWWNISLLVVGILLWIMIWVGMLIPDDSLY